MLTITPFDEMIMDIETNDFISSNLESGSYDDQTREMEITFQRGDSYTYYNVPPDVWQALKYASSPGRYLRDNVIGKY